MASFKHSHRSHGTSTTRKKSILNVARIRCDDVAWGVRHGRVPDKNQESLPCRRMSFDLRCYGALSVNMYRHRVESSRLFRLNPRHSYAVGLISHHPSRHLGWVHISCCGESKSLHLSIGRRITRMMCVQYSGMIWLRVSKFNDNNAKIINTLFYVKTYI